MELKVFNGEYFDRGKTRYVVFAFIILLVAVLSILSSNIIGGVIVLLFAAGYLYFSLKSNKTIVITIGKKVLQVGKTIYQWSDLKGFVLEYHTKKKRIHNIVIIDKNNDFKIYTLNDSEKNIEEFVNELNGYIPLLENYEQSTLDKFIRKIKL